MKRNRILILCLCAALLMSACQSHSNVSGGTLIPVMSKADGDAIKQREISVWEYSKTRQYDRLREILGDDFIGHFNTGDLQPSQLINQLRNTTINAYHLSNIVVKPVAPDAAIVYYDALQDVVGADGQPWIPAIKATAYYAKRNGNWYEVFYQEMPAQ